MKLTFLSSTTGVNSSGDSFLPLLELESIGGSYWHEVKKKFLKIFVQTKAHMYKAAHSVNGLVDGTSSSGSFKQILKVGTSLTDRKCSNQNAEEDSQNLSSVG